MRAYLGVPRGTNMTTKDYMDQESENDEEQRFQRYREGSQGKRDRPLVVPSSSLSSEKPRKGNRGGRGSTFATKYPDKIKAAIEARSKN